MNSSQRMHSFSPNNAYFNHGVAYDSDVDIQYTQPRSPSNVLPEFLRTIGNNRNDGPLLGENITEEIPTLDFYRRDGTIHKKRDRPQLEELHSPDSANYRKENMTDAELGDPLASKLGWVDGVYIRTMMNLFGVMLYLRMSWMAGQAGVILSLVQIIVATIVTVVTTTSMIALCTNGDIGGGGIYSMLSRNVGREAGGVIGFMFTFTNAAFVGLNLLGTAESVSEILKTFEIGICEVPSGTNDQRIVGYILLVIIALIPIISLEFEAKTMMFFFLTLVVSLIDYFVGSLIPPSEAQKGMGFAYWHDYVIVPNLFPRWDGQTFFTVFAVFFPSVTGIFTGASMSADLKDPATAIPKGTFLAIATTSTTYAAIIIFTGFTVVGYATGDPADIVWNNLTCASRDVCPYGLINNYQTMAVVGMLTRAGLRIEPIIYAGIFAATLSSALGCYTAAPRIFQAMCDDHLIPIIGWFGKGYGPSRDPRHAYIITFIIACIFIAIGDVNAAGTWISNFYLGAFFMVNFALFHVSWVESISFRPSFKWFNHWVSLVIGIFCIVLMFLFDYISAAVVCGLTIIIYLLMIFVDPSKANWGSSTEAQCFNIARYITFRLDAYEDHVKKYRPNIILLCGNPRDRQQLVDMANRMTKKYGLLYLTQIIQEKIGYKTIEKITSTQRLWIKSAKINAFYKLIETASMSDGIKSTLQTIGTGKFTPNIVMLGYKTNWKSCVNSNLIDYYNTIHNVLDMHFSIILFRVKGGLDYGQYFENSYNDNDLSPSTNIYSISGLVDSQNNVSYDRVDSDGKPAPILVYETTNQFKTKQKAGFIDVWWLYEDGGLTILIPYILKNNSLWKGCSLRIFTVTDSTRDVQSVKVSLTELLHKFRIPVSAVHVLSDTDCNPAEETMKRFKEILITSTDGSSPARNTVVPSMEELIQYKDQTNKYLKVRELLVQWSKTSTLIAMTLPIPPKNNLSAALYMAWLELLTHDMPPFLLIRGNQTSVLTFYC